MGTPATSWPALVVAFTAGIGQAEAATFTWLGDLSGGTSYSEALAVSADGRVVVGYAGSPNGEEAFRYENGVMTGLGDLPGRTPYESRATAVSADGAIVAGTSGTFWGVHRPQAFLWSNDVLTELGSLTNCIQPPLSTAEALSDDGAVLVGMSCAPNGITAAAYRNDAWEDLGAYPTFEDSYGSAVSPEGDVIGGQEMDEDLSGRAFLVEDNAIAPLGGFPAGVVAAWPDDISAGGAVVVGAWADEDDNVEAYRYTNGVPTGLGYLPGGEYASYAAGVSADGSVVVGSSDSVHKTGAGSQAFVWTGVQGMQRLEDVLATQAATGFDRWRDSLVGATAVSADGLTIVGFGFGPPGGQRQAWLAVLDSPVAADTDGDGVIDGIDNCTTVANPEQCDSDGDEYGNRCDGDFSDNNATNAQDTTLFRQQLGAPSAAPKYNAADLNCNGAVNAQDTVIFRGLLGSPPGPSGWRP